MLAGVCRAQAPPNPSQRTVDVTGHGDANAKPDTLIISFAVDSQAPTADECTRAHADKVRKVIDALKDMLGADTKIETSEYSLNPNTTYVTVPAPAPPEPKEFWELKSQITASSDDLDLMGPLIDTAMASGATAIGQSGIGDFPSVEESRSWWFFGHRKRHHRMKRMAYIVVLVDAQGASASEATSKGAPRIAQIQKALSEKLGERGEVKLTQFNIAPLNPNQPGRYMPPAPQQVQQQVQNYVAHTTITAETTKLDQLGPAVQAGLDAGAARLNQVQFTLRNDADARKAAIDKASSEAKTKAEAVAKSMGITLGRVVRISTNGAVRPQTIYGQSFQAAFSASLHRSEAANVPVMPKEVGFSADVSVSYEIQ